MSWVFGSGRDGDRGARRGSGGATTTSRRVRMGAYRSATGGDELSSIFQHVAQSVAEWQTLLSDSHAPMMDNDVSLEIAVCLQQSTAGQSGAFLAQATDGNKYWVKPRNNLQGPQVCYTELVVSRLGELIDAPVCTVRPIRISADFAGWEFRPGHVLEVGTGSASQHVPGVIEERDLLHRTDDNNASRHVGVLALAAWLGGLDQQWLYASPDNRTFSHDHGHFLPGGPSWTPESLQQAIVEPPSLPGAIPHGHGGLDATTIEHTYETLVQHVTQEAIAIAVSAYPGSWAISLAHRATLAYYADSRRDLAALALEQIKLGAP